MFLRLLTTSAVVALGLAALPAPAIAQDQNPPAVAAEDISDQQLESFAAAALAVNRIGREWAGRIEATEDEARLEEMQIQAREEMAAAVREEGLTVEEYNAIYAAADGDPELTSTIETLIREQAGG